jgi:hypothetical protein
VSEDKPKYTISDFTEAGIHQFVQDISSPLQDEWDKNAKKENVSYFTPVQYILPPLNPPFPFDDKITGEHLEFPTKDEWLDCPDDKKSELYHKSLDDFEAYREDYNKRVDEYFTDNGIEKDPVAQAKSGVYKYEKGRSHFEFMTINHPFHYDQVDKHSHNKWKPELGLHWKKADNELVYTAIVDMDDADAIPVINKTVYDYIKAITNDRDLKEGDIYYNPMRELMRWAEVESIDFNDVPNVLQMSAIEKTSHWDRLFPELVVYNEWTGRGGPNESTSPSDWHIMNNLMNHQLTFAYQGGQGRQLKRYSYEECGFNYYRGKDPPRKIQLLEQYAIWKEMREKSPKSVSLTWEDCVLINGNRHYTMRIQRDLNKHLKSLLHIAGDIFEKRTEEVGGEKFTYYECLLIGLTTVSQEKESHKRFTKESQKKSRMKMPSGINDFSRDKKLGRDDIESGVYHYGLDDGDLIDQ